LPNLFRIAYIEFADKESSLKAKHLNESLFKGRQLTVEPKRKNVPGRGRGNGMMGFNGRGANNPINMLFGMMQRFQRGFGRGRGGRGMPGGMRGAPRGRGGPSAAEQTPQSEQK
jgi:polyadenylate-binding protein 2